VCGPPGSGKTRYVDERRQPGDIVIDLDAIKARLSGHHWYHPQSDIRLDDAIHERNQRLRALAYEKAAVRAWFIVGAPARSEREWWAKSLGNCSVIVLDVAPEVCLERIDMDERRAGRAREFSQAVHGWWARYEPE